MTDLPPDPAYDGRMEANDALVAVGGGWVVGFLGLFAGPMAGAAAGVWMLSAAVALVANLVGMSRARRALGMPGAAGPNQAKAGIAMALGVIGVMGALALGGLGVACSGVGSLPQRI